MSLRALGRQFMAQRANRDKPWWTGTERHPQGTLFGPQEGGRQPLSTPDMKEAMRRRGAGEANPKAPWRTPHWSDKHFPPPPGTVRHTAEQGELFK